MTLRATLLLLAALPGTALADTAPFDALAPLLAGTYTGACKAKPDLDDTPGASAITVSADGKVRAPGVEFDLRDSLLMELSRTVAGSKPEVKAVFRTMYEESYFLLVPERGGYVAAAKSDEHEFSCDEVKTTPGLNASPFWLSMAAALDAERTVACRRAEHDTPRNVVFHLAQGKGRLDDQKLDLAHSGKETLVISQGRAVQYGARLANGRTFTVAYDVRGDLIGVGILAGDKLVIGCEGVKGTQ